MTRYRKKPIVIEAIQFTGENYRAVVNFMGIPIGFKTDSENKCHFDMCTPEGIMTVDEGDYIIKGIKGEFYPCKPDIFDETYEEVKE